jgi:redox-sensitive bicupin YhaK (pirin superfamily)
MTASTDPITTPNTGSAGFRLHPAAERGPTRLGWLDSRHSFSFGRYYDPRKMGFRSLRVINDDRIGPGGGFGEHPHDNMEIVSYVVHGGLAHKDSLGNGSTIRPGDIQRMTAGTGIRHSEFNPSETEAGRFLQIWILPEREGIEPSYEEKATGVHDHPGSLRTIVSPDGGPHAVRIHQDVTINAGVFAPGQGDSRRFAPDRFGWIQVVRGDFDLTVNGRAIRVGEGDGVELDPGAEIAFTAVNEAELLVFDLA